MYGWIYFVIIPTFMLIFFFAQGFRESPLSLWEALYFSAVTITTLGYGDIQPTLALTRFFAGAEAVLGVLTVGMFLSALSHSRSTELAKEESDRQDERNKSLATTGVVKHSLLLLPLTRLHYSATVSVSTLQKNFNSNSKFDESFPFSNFSELFEPGFLTNDALFRPKI